MRTIHRSLATALMLAAPHLVGCSSTPAAPAPTHFAVGDDWRLVDYDGREHAVGAYLERGEPVVLVFWETWCGSCLAEAPAVEELHRTRPRVHVFGVVAGAASDALEADVRGTAMRLRLSYPQVLDRDLVLTNALAVQGTPTVVVLGRGGAFLARGHELPGDWSAFGG
jgi:thiol-disulfide isomerase/thioredoxin